nr:DUF2232 domain-containing protein [Gehongia tenuis]
MTNDPSIRSVNKGLVFVLVALVLLTLVAYSSFFFLAIVPLVILATLLSVWVGVQKGLWAAAASLAALSGLWALLISPVFLVYLALLIVPALILTYGIRSGWTLAKTVLAGVISMIVISAAAYYGLSLYLKEDPIVILVGWMEESLTSLTGDARNELYAYYQLLLHPNLAAAQGIPAPSAEEFTAMVKDLTSACDTFLRTNLPVALVITGVAGGFFGAYVPMAWLRPALSVKVPSFSLLELPRQVGTGFFVLLIAAFLGYLLNWTDFDIVFNLVVTLFTLVFGFMGAALVDFLLKRQRLNTGLRTVIIVLCIAIPLVNTLLPLAGIMEHTIHIRRRMLALDINNRKN